jgi:hypothetical protein
MSQLKAVSQFFSLLFDSGEQDTGNLIEVLKGQLLQQHQDMLEVGSHMDKF